nr:hypothetical protein [Tanacetum cinerariifolium]
MSSQKHGSSDTSSDEKTSPSLSPDGSKVGVGRSYECTFCKRGFTNAQALGGHMNIHRKDKAKAKAKHQNTFTSTSTMPKKNNSICSSKSFKFLPDEETRYFGASYGFQMGDHGSYDQFIPSNPNFPWNFPSSQFNDFAAPSEHARVNLNLGIGTSELEENNIVSEMVGPEEWFEKEVDLELRLGHYP